MYEIEITEASLGINVFFHNSYDYKKFRNYRALWLNLYYKIKEERKKWNEMVKEAKRKKKERKKVIIQEMNNSKKKEKEKGNIVR